MKRLPMLLIALITFGFLHHRKPLAACDAQSVQQFIGDSESTLDTYRDGSFEQSLEESLIEQTQADLDELGQNPCNAELVDRITQEIHGLHLMDKAMQRANWI